MKKLFLTSIIVCAGFFLFAAGGNNSTVNSDGSINFSGTVQDKYTGESLAGVLVQIENTGLYTYTDLNGNFHFKGVMPGDYTFSAKYISYETHESDYSINSESGNLYIELENQN